MADEITAWLDGRKKELQDWHDRIDEDRKLYWLEDYKLTDANSRDFAKAYSVTRNTPRNYAHAIIGDLTNAEMLPVVESNQLSDTAISKVENFVNDAWAAIDEWTAEVYQLSATDSAHESMPIAGAIISRNFFYVDDNGEIIPDVQMWDPRWSAWEWSRNGGIAKAATWGKRTKADAINAYGIDEETIAKIEAAYGKETKGKDCVEYLDELQHMVIIDDNRVIEREHGYKDNGDDYCPVTVQLSSLGSFFTDEDGSTKYMGESVYGPLRKLYPELNRLASVQLTKSMSSLQRTLAIKTKPEDLAALQKAFDGTPESGPSSTAQREIKPIPRDSEVEELYRYEDTTKSDQYIGGLLGGDEDQAGYSNLDYGDFNSANPPSGSAMRIISEKRERIVNQVAKSICSWKQKVTRMFITQMIDGNISGPLGPAGKRGKYAGSELKGEFSLEIRYVVTIPERVIGNYALAEAASKLGIVDEKTILSDIMEFQEPEKVLRRARLERQAKLNPAIDAYLAAMAEADEGDPILAKMLFLQAEMQVDQMLNQGMQVDQEQQQLGGVIDSTMRDITPNEIQLPRPKAGKPQAPQVRRQTTPILGG